MSNGRALGVRHPAPPSAHAPRLPLEGPGCAQSIIDAFVLLLSERKAWNGGLTFRRHLDLNRHFNKMQGKKKVWQSRMFCGPPRRPSSVLLKCRDPEGIEIKRNPFRGRITYHQKIVLFCMTWTRTQLQGSTKIGFRLKMKIFFFLFCRRFQSNSFFRALLFYKPSSVKLNTVFRITSIYNFFFFLSLVFLRKFLFSELSLYLDPWDRELRKMSRHFELDWNSSDDGSGNLFWRVPFRCSFSIVQ